MLICFGLLSGLGFNVYYHYVCIDSVYVRLFLLGSGLGVLRGCRVLLGCCLGSVLWWGFGVLCFWCFGLLDVVGIRW